MSKKGILLVNLGSPDSTSVGDVRKYLRQFLMDPKVLDAAFPIRFFVVHCLILPKRPVDASQAYQPIWTDEGSPLIALSRDLQASLQERITDCPIELAMRYQNPSIESAVDKLQQRGVDDLVVLPLFPHYAMSSYESAAERVKKVIAKRAPEIQYRIVPPFFDNTGYIEALAEMSAPYMEKEFDHFLFSFHGLPERHMRLADPTGEHCLSCEDCCSGEHPAHATCYRAQCFKTVAAFVEATGLGEGQYSVAFQSRLGRDPWLKPYSDKVIEEFPAKGIKKILVISPAFVSDCLETLEELGIRAKEDFIAAGGEEFTLIPCLNTNPRWVDAVEKMVK